MRSRSAPSSFARRTCAAFEAALQSARAAERTTVIYAPIDTSEGVPAYESWWNVPIAEVSQQPAVEAARRDWESRQKKR